MEVNINKKLLMDERYYYFSVLFALFANNFFLKFIFYYGLHYVTIHF